MGLRFGVLVGALCAAGACGGTVVTVGDSGSPGTSMTATGDDATASSSGSSAASGSSNGGGAVEDVTSPPSGGSSGGVSGSSSGTSGVCTLPSVDTGTPYAFWSCVRAACEAEIAACATDCTCNDAVGAALACYGSDPLRQHIMACFTQALAPVATDPAVAALVPCLQVHLGCLPDAGAQSSDAASGG